MTERTTDAVALARLAGDLVDRTLTPRIAARFPKEQAAEAHRLLKQGGLRGRVVLLFDDESS